MSQLRAFELTPALGDPALPNPVWILAYMHDSAPFALIASPLPSLDAANHLIAANAKRLGQTVSK